MLGSGRRREDDDEAIESEEEYVVDDLRDRIKSSRASRFDLLTNELGLESIKRKFNTEISLLVNGNDNGNRYLPISIIIFPDTRWYRLWVKFILIWAIYSSFFTPMEFAYFNGLSKKLLILDTVGQIVFLIDIVLQFFVAYRDNQTYKFVYKRTPIALRYLKSHFIVDLLGCMPWDIIYKACGRKEVVRYLLWIRLSRVRKVTAFFHKTEKDIRINYLFTRIVKLIIVELYCTHTAACIFYYLATTLPEEQEDYTWIGSLKMGNYSYSHFRDIDLWTRYITSLYFAIVTMATVGYGDIHAVNTREMIFVMICVSFDMILSAYLLGNISALIVKGSKTVRFRDKMTDLTKYINRNRLGRDIRNQIKGHLLLQYESSYTEASVLQDIPISIRAKISQTLYKTYIENVPLFKGCSPEFITQIVIKVHEEFFLPGEVIMEQGNAIDQIYFICDGTLEEVGIRADGTEETVSLLETYSSFGEIAILCNIPQPYTVRVCELCRLLRVKKQSFSKILEIHFLDRRRIFNNLLEGKETNLRFKNMEYDINIHIGRHEEELTLRVNNAAYYGDLPQLKKLIRIGADPNKSDYDGRSPLHVAASRGYEDVTLFLIQQGVDINASDKFGNTPLLEAIRSGHDRVASFLRNGGASLKIDDAGSLLCTTVARGDCDLLKRLLANGLNPDSCDYDNRTPLHLAASQGLYFMAKLLVEAGASVFVKDRFGNTPIEEAQISGNKNMMKLLQDAKLNQFSQGIKDEKVQKMKCSVFPYHPWNYSKDEVKERKDGVVLWVPNTIDDLIQTASKHLNLPWDCNGNNNDSYILSEDGGKILDVEMINDYQKLYLITQTHSN
ncbi:potassium channel SKOR-like [Impatiens glandulifera]|uniref:potassium channel SKOR-like n=1 Tax=Impatiens glandulifera TaxID=253017 RepID=UPI001FB14254|nr:potassium channel SKOR-like [Impatiens glandulifera]